MNVIDFIKSTADYMVMERPDVYNTETAVATLYEAIEGLRQHEGFACVSFTSYFLCRYVDEGIEQFLMSRKVSGLLVSEAEEAARAFSYDPVVDLPYILDEALDDDDGL